MNCSSSLPTDNSKILLGDFSSPDINWLSLNAMSYFSCSLSNLLYTRNYIQ